jgi:hypothetical protein
MLPTSNGARILAVTRAMMRTTTLTANGRTTNNPGDNLEIFILKSLIENTISGTGAISPKDFDIPGAARGASC